VPRFFFHTNHPSEAGIQDDVGFQFPNVHAAKCEAVAYAGRMLCDAALNFWNTADFELTVTDDKGMILFTMSAVGTEAPAIRTAPRHGV